jgi:arylsulfatase A-like enzyme
MSHLRTFVLLLVSGLFLAIPRLRAQEAPTGPNIVMILSDDQAWTDYGLMGHPDVKTPHLDRLASRSAVFKRGYTPVPLCRPSLLSMITGKYPHQHGVTGNDPKPDKSLSDGQYGVLREQLISKIDQQATLPKLLAGKSYLSMQSGKWWEGNFSRGGFTHGMTRGFPQKGGRHGDDGLEIGRKGMQPIYDFVQHATDEKKPFFLWYAPMLPHTPHNPPERLLSKYQKPGRPEALAKYYAMCEFFDETCGDLLNHLDEKKLTENTIVVYVTDNGWIQATPEMKLGPDWNHGFAPRSKQTVYEGGIRTPIMISWPGRIDPGNHPELASTIDVFPTLLAATGLDVPADLPGVNLLPLLKDKTPLDRTFLCGESFSHDIIDMDQHEATLQYRWCIEGKWKLILSYDSPPDRYAFVYSVNERTPQLFDLEADPHEKQNLASSHPEIVQKLAKHLQDTWSVSKQPVGL